MDALTIIRSPTARHQCAHADSLQEGLKRHGVKATQQMRGAVAVGTKYVACWGWRIGAAYRAAGHEVLVMERGYMGDRFAWTSLGWNGLNGRAEFHVREDASRFEQHFAHLLQPWNPAGSYVLLIGQTPNDAALAGRDLSDWYAEQAAEARRVYGLPVRFRPHPLAWSRGHRREVPGTVLAPDGDLASEIAGAALVVTYNSNTGVESMLAGKPTVTADAGAMAWPVAARSIVAATTSEPPRRPWAEELAWCQFTLDEIRSGFAWECVGHG